MMGLEEHLLNMFRGDFEFHDGAAPSHLGPAAKRAGNGTEVASDAATASPEEASAAAAAHAAVAAAMAVPSSASAAGAHAAWTTDAEKELKKIPFFVRGKARRNTEAYAGEQGLSQITVETLYDAKAHYSR
jgi:light-independent protochlorophyllide reductase subunit B